MKHSLNSIAQHLVMPITDVPLFYHHVHLAEYVIVIHRVHNQTEQLVTVLQ